MRLYHGSNLEIDQVDLSKSARYKDFCLGFYTTVFEEQAWTVARRKVNIGGGNPVLTIFEVPDDILEKADLRCRVFDEKPSVEWAIFVKNNRDRKFENISSLECNADNKYDIVVGPLADDKVNLLVRQFSRGTIDEEMLQRRFTFGKLSNQYSFHSEKALGYLKKIGAKYDEHTTGND